MYKNFKRKLAVLVTSSLVLTSVSMIPQISTAAPSNEEIPSWAAKEIAYWVDAGLLQGKLDGMIHPDDVVTKAEFVTLLNRVFNFSKKSSQTFSDVPADAWYATEMSKAFAANILDGNGDGTAGPSETMTREKAAVVISKAFSVKNSANSSSSFTDEKQISSWAQSFVHALKDSGYVSGFPDGSFKPDKTLTRAEAIKMINNVMGILVSDAATHDQVTGKNLLVNTAGSVLSNVKLSGDLYITPGVGEGNVTITNSQIDGTVYVQGGGLHTVTFEGSKIGQIVVNKPEVRVLLSGNSSVDNVVIQQESVLELDTTATVSNLEVNAPAEIRGEGEVTNATVNAEGTTFAKAPVEMILNVENATVAGKVVTNSGTPPVTGSGPISGPGDSNTTPPTPPAPIVAYGTWGESLADNSVPQNVKSYITEIRGVTNELGGQKNIITDDLFGVTPNVFPIMLGENINTSYMDSNKNLWIGTKTNLIYRDNATGAFKEFGADVLGYGNVDMIISDKMGGIWALVGSAKYPTTLDMPPVDYSDTKVIHITKSAVSN